MNKSIFSLIKKLAGGDAEKVIRGMSTLLVGASSARAVGLIAVPVLTRIYSPEDYGILSIYSSLVLIIAPFLTLRYVQAIPLTRQEGSAFNLMVLSFACAIVMSAIACIVLWLGQSMIFNLISMEQLRAWWWLVLVGAIGMAFYEMMSMWATRARAYRAIAKTQFSQSCLGEATKVLLGVIGVTPLGLLLGQAASLSGGSIALYLKFKEDFGRHVRKVTFTRVLAMAQHFRSYPIYRLPSQILLVISMQGPLILSSVYFSVDVVGQLGLALMVLSLPANLLGESVSRAFYAEAAKVGRRNPKRIKKMTFTTMAHLAIIGIVPTVLLILSGEAIFMLAFGAEWSKAGAFASCLSVYLLFQFIQKPVSYLMYIFDAQQKLLYLSAQRVVLMFGCFWLGASSGLDEVAVITIYSAVLAIHYLISIFVAVKMIPSGV